MAILGNMCSDEHNHTAITIASDSPKSPKVELLNITVSKVRLLCKQKL